MTTAVLDQGRRPWRREVATRSCPTRAPTRPSMWTAAWPSSTCSSSCRERRRQCVVLRYFVDLSVEETALQLGINAGTVKSQTARALEQVRASLVALGLDVELEELS